MHVNSKTHKELGKLLIQAQQGNLRAFEEIYEATVKQQYYLAVKTLKNEVNAEDVTQEVFIYLFEHLKDIRNPIALISYMNKTNYHLCLKALDKMHEGLELCENIEAKDDVDKKAKESIQHLLETAMFELDTKTREVVVLKYMQEFKTSEIANYLNVSQRTVQRLIKDGISEMKKNLQLATHRQYGFAIFCLPYLSKMLSNSVNSALSSELKRQMLTQIAGDLALPVVGVSAMAATGAVAANSLPVVMSKIAIGSTVATVVVYSGYQLIQPQFNIVKMQSDSTYSIVNSYQIQPSFGTTIRQVIVYDEEMNEYINYQGVGGAEISITRNGNYIIRVVDDKNMTTEKNININNIDNICPTVEVSFDNGDVVMMVDDKHSGVDFESLVITGEDGETINKISQIDNKIRYPNTKSTVVSIKDKLGNETQVRIDK